MGRQHRQRQPFGRDDPPKSLRLLLHPAWRIFHSAILPGTKPEQNQLEVVLACPGNQVIDNAEVKGPLNRLYLFPIDWDLSSISMHADESIPERSHPLLGIGAGIMNLSTQDKERFTIHGHVAARVNHHSSFLLSSFYSQSTFYTGYIVYTASLLVAPSKGIFGQKHRGIKIDEGESTQTSSEMCGSSNSQA